MFTLETEKQWQTATCSALLEASLGMRHPQLPRGRASFWKPDECAYTRFCTPKQVYNFEDFTRAPRPSDLGIGRQGIWMCVRRSITASKQISRSSTPHWMSNQRSMFRGVTSMGTRFRNFHSFLCKFKSSILRINNVMGFMLILQYRLKLMY